MFNVAGLCVRGDGALRSDAQELQFVGTTIVCDVGVNKVGVLLSQATAVKFENITFYGSTAFDGDRAIGVWIDSPGTGSSGIQFQNCSFTWCDKAVVTGYTNNNSELSFIDCSFNFNTIGFKSYSYQAVVQKFIGCTGGGTGGATNNMDIMFDLSEGGGNLTVVGFGGGNMDVFLKVGAGGGNVGWNEFFNVRLEEQGDWADTHRILLYDAVDTGSVSGAQKTAFYGVLVVNSGTVSTQPVQPRFSLYVSHEVQVWNITRDANGPVATVERPLLGFPEGESAQPGGTFRCFASDVPDDARLDRDKVPAGAVYSFQDCQDQLVPYPNRFHPPLYGPNYFMSLESHCFQVGDALNGVNGTASASNNVEPAVPSDAFRAGVIRCTTTTTGYATLHSHAQAIKPGGGTWRFQAAVRVTAVPSGGETPSPEIEVRMGFGDIIDAEPENGAYFRYRNTINGAKWEGVLIWNDTEEAFNTDEAKDEDWHTFEIEVDESGTSARFYIDGAYVGTAENVFEEIGTTGLMPLQFVRTGGSGTKSAEIDYYKYELRPSTVSPMYPE